MTSPQVDLVADDVRLVVSDLDGTLLDADGAVPDGLWPLLDELDGRGIVFSPASGRQYATMRRSFAHRLEGMVVIAENGGYVVRDDVEVDSTPLADDVTAHTIELCRRLAVGGTDLGVVRCGRTLAHVERRDRAFLANVEPYYASLAGTDDLMGFDGGCVKVAVWTPHDPDTVLAPALAPLADVAQVVVSGSHWVDVMPLGVDKGTAVGRLQESLGVTPAQTVVFGDQPNDLGMLAAADHSFAMAGAHPRVLDAARYRAPSHAEAGVLVVLRDLLDLPPA